MVEHIFQAYKANDGTLFEDRAEAETHELETAVDSVRNALSGTEPKTVIYWLKEGHTDLPERIKYLADFIRNCEYERRTMPQTAPIRPEIPTENE